MDRKNDKAAKQKEEGGGKPVQQQQQQQQQEQYLKKESQNDEYYKGPEKEKVKDNVNGMANDAAAAVEDEEEQVAKQIPREEEGGHPHHAGHREIKPFDQVVKEEEQFIGRSLTPQELQMVKQRLDYMKEHEGHEGAHSEMLLVMLGGLVASQILIGIWKKQHITSYNLFTLLGLWFMPFIMAIKNSWSTFLLLWSFFSLLNTYIVYRALETPVMRSGTPRLVYWWYQMVYDVSYFVGACGYTISLLAFFHLPQILGYSMDTEAETFLHGLTILFYGLYFGTLGRDFVDRLSDVMATTMGYYSRKGFPKKHLREGFCAICGESTKSSPSNSEGGEKLHILNCGHTYHELCIRGWTIVGKKDICPYCKEKVDLKAFRKNPWDTSQVLFLQFLDVMRYLLVFNPLCFLVIHWVIEGLGLK